MENDCYCRDCGTQIHPRAEICPNCGVRQRFSYADLTSSRNRMVAAILALFLGGFGMHKFYLGRPLQGLFYILFCWTGIPFFVGLIEGIMYLVMSDEEFKLRYGY